MSKINGVLFDHDGTLLDTTEYILQAYEYVLKKHNALQPDFRHKMKALFGKPLVDCYKELTPTANYKELCFMHSRWQAENL